MNVRKGTALVLCLCLCLSLCGCVFTAAPGESLPTRPPMPGLPTEAAGLPASPEPSQAPSTDEPKGNTPSEEQDNAPDEDGSYDSAEDVARYIYIYGELPDNYITKDEAEELGWSGGSLEKYAPGMCIGGDRFGNREGLLPKANGRTWTECDIDTLGEDSRGAKRIVFSNDGLIYYTDDHYESFQRLYPED